MKYRRNNRPVLVIQRESTNFATCYPSNIHRIKRQKGGRKVLSENKCRRVNFTWDKQEPGLPCTWK